MNQLTTAFVLIVNHIANGDFVCDQETPIRHLFDEGFSDSDFELAITAFEATYRTSFSDQLWDDAFDDFADLTVEDFVDRYMLDDAVRDPLYITNRLLDLRDTILEESEEEGQGD